MRPQCLLLLVVLILPLAAATSTVQIGGWKPIEDVSNPVVREAAEFVASEYNTKQAKDRNKLVFETVLRGETQLVAGTNYKLVISAKNESSVANPTRVIGTAAANNYKVFVYDRAWGASQGIGLLSSFEKKLTSFKDCLKFITLYILL